MIDHSGSCESRAINYLVPFFRVAFDSLKLYYIHMTLIRGELRILLLTADRSLSPIH